jgi:hypothetical protein
MLFFFLGCSKVTQENYDKIRVGMNYNEVVAILGKPNSCDSVANVNSCVWGNVSKNIKVRFVSERAVFLNAQGIK